MADASFEVRNSIQFDELLKEQVKEFENDNLSSEKAIIAFILGYHLREGGSSGVSP